MISERSISVSGIGTSYYESGIGEPIVSLHGAGFGADGKSSFVRQLNDLSDQFRVIAVDQLQCGGTDYPADQKFVNRLGRVDHVIGFIEALGLKQITLVGHSEGSFVAARVAILRPDLVSRLVLLTASSVSPAYGDDRDETWWQAYTEAYDNSSPMPSEEEYVAAWRKSTRAYGQDVEEAKREAYRRAAARGQYEILQSLPEEETNLRLYVVLQQTHVFPYLDRLRAETLIIWSKNDPTVPPDRGIKLAKLIKNSDFHLLNNAGHDVQIDQSEAVNRLIRHWTAKSPTKGN
ncbi:MAG: alpha/beta hydrolase [Mesorhizobium sp.]|uniref:alpha/beta fold hydrolase n=1 Tax=unclassified Mesorhizobium TaxID=325217 RepID=UPI000FC9DCE7|nr:MULTISPECIES: alpha/beta hydrolase [unclassified Mesorhizobium]TGU88445.1 alpha/beta hydrolase [Mesorhizobium sp. M00.F.Ca.ET.151.01.1.1]TGV09361.1 alpha/beta hydrolase [Mesorhizobium sp. M8A.F.Ca.ET.173.01.1.1]TGV56107.1 alpha/beta hydrolase [bacterium M00.F.Ca.ET.141.01.1.1]RUW81663.1 alpha/beta hydrolase [Mesorhizobium sp. M2A.F.Ca.ET.067.02.1.1]RVD65560.1 alpha/beta hydrolase [Mesorhizobium sp. M7A.F.Ca.ET.027.03.2.1]